MREQSMTGIISDGQYIRVEEIIIYEISYLKISWKSFCGVFNMRERTKGGSKLGAVYDLVFERRL